MGEGKNWPVAEFLSTAATEYTHDFSKITALLEHCVCHGIPRNLQKARKLEGYDGLFEFKAGCLRIFWFWDKGKMVICTHGIVKKSQKTPSGALETAEKRMKAFKEARKKNQIEILEP